MMARTHPLPFRFYILAGEVRYYSTKDGRKGSVLIRYRSPLLEGCLNPLFWSLRRTWGPIRERETCGIQGWEPEGWKVQEGLVLGSGSAGTMRQDFLDFTHMLCH